jgi:hypothetical protein
MYSCTDADRVPQISRGRGRLASESMQAIRPHAVCHDKPLSYEPERLPKNKVTAEYALANIDNPMGVATYRTTEALPEDLQDKLPALSELAARLEEVPEESEEAHH